MHDLNENWILYIHYPNDLSWDISSYKKIIDICTIESAIEIFNLISLDLYNKCMFFLMRSNIKPVWEDPENIDGGAFSFKIDNKISKKIWKNICYQAIGETLINCKEGNYITGITLSPKKNFGILKIWTKLCIDIDTNCINNIDTNLKESCIFKKHINKN
tara:strand:+ start:220 stop:699 length:480 start_codon:yes stop_codon:yes gene_type:complete